MKNILVIDRDQFLVNRLIRFIQSSLRSECHVEGATTVEEGWESLKHPDLLVAEVTQRWFDEICEILEKFSSISDFDRKIILTSGEYLSLRRAKNRFPWIPCIKKPFNEAALERAIKSEIIKQEEEEA